MDRDIRKNQAQQTATPLVDGHDRRPRKRPYEAPHLTLYGDIAAIAASGVGSTVELARNQPNQHP